MLWGCGDMLSVQALANPSAASCRTAGFHRIQFENPRCSLLIFFLNESAESEGRYLEFIIGGLYVTAYIALKVPGKCASPTECMAHMIIYGRLHTTWSGDAYGVGERAVRNVFSDFAFEFIPIMLRACIENSSGFLSEPRLLKCREIFFYYYYGTPG